MKFYEWHTLWSYVKPKCIGTAVTNASQYSDWVRGEEKRDPERFAGDNQLMGVRAYVEAMWYCDSRPYYKAYPSICRSLEKITLDIPCCDIPTPPYSQMCIRYADGCGDIDSILFTIMPSNKTHKQLGMFVQPRTRTKLSVVRGAVTFPLTDETIEDVLSSAKQIGPGDPLTRIALRSVIGVCLLSSDPSIITPDVIAADQHKYYDTGDQKYIEKAHRRGLVGWSIGKEFETCPHYRRPHLALRHTGKGRTVPRIVPVKGCVVHRDVMTQVPTGYVLPNGEEYEPKPDK